MRLSQRRSAPKQRAVPDNEPVPIVNGAGLHRAAPHLADSGLRIGMAASAYLGLSPSALPVFYARRSQPRRSLSTLSSCSVSLLLSLSVLAFCASVRIVASSHPIAALEATAALVASVASRPRVSRVVEATRWAALTTLPRGREAPRVSRVVEGTRRNQTRAPGGSSPITSRRLVQSPAHPQ